MQGTWGLRNRVWNRLLTCASSFRISLRLNKCCYRTKNHFTNSAQTRKKTLYGKLVDISSFMNISVSYACYIYEVAV